MKTIYVDDEPWMIKRFCLECENVKEIELVATFEDSLMALEYAKSHEVNCAFLDINMRNMDGLCLAEKLKEIDSSIIIIYISAYDQYMMDAFKNKGADYYILKPYTSEELASAFYRAKLLSARQKKKIYIETFGVFSVYSEGKAIDFKSRTAKEILALLVEKRGTALTNKEAFYYMYEDLPYSHENMTRIRKGINRLREVLLENSIEELVISTRSEHRLNTSVVDCDYYDFLDGKPQAYSKYRGEYMIEYAWAEETNARLNSLAQDRKDRLIQENTIVGVNHD